MKRGFTLDSIDRYKFGFNPGSKGIQAICLGGSHPRGTATTNSDIDIGIYYSANCPPCHSPRLKRLNPTKYTGSKKLSIMRQPCCLAPFTLQVQSFFIDLGVVLF